MPRPDEYAAEQAIRDFLYDQLGVNSDDRPPATLVEHGSEWAFYLLADDMTSFVREDLSIEWNGTGWEPEADPTP